MSQNQYSKFSQKRFKLQELKINKSQELTTIAAH